MWKHGSCHRVPREVCELLFHLAGPCCEEAASAGLLMREWRRCDVLSLAGVMGDRRISGIWAVFITADSVSAGTLRRCPAVVTGRSMHSILLFGMRRNQNSLRLSLRHVFCICRS
jgi:hypothetical protein